MSVKRACTGMYILFAPNVKYLRSENENRKSCSGPLNRSMGRSKSPTAFELNVLSALRLKTAKNRQFPPSTRDKVRSFFLLFLLLSFLFLPLSPLPLAPGPNPASLARP